MSGGSLPYKYIMGPTGGTNQTATISAGIYTVSVIYNHGCTSSASVTITQPSTSIGSLTTSITYPSCFGGTGSITASVNALSKTFTYEAAVQHFSLPASVTVVTVTVTGAAGGNDESGAGSGPGASFSGVCAVTGGHVLSVAVGGLGATNTVDDGSGGGGATWVYDSNSVTLLAAAGGGGGAGFSGNAGGTGGTIITSPYTATNGTGGNAAGGTGGNGGAAVSASTAAGGGGGAGWISNGLGGASTGTDGASFGGNDRASGFAQTNSSPSRP